MKIKILIAFFLCIASASLLGAQETASGLELLTVNDQVTTVITATEPIRFVDISTGKVAGDQPLSNTLRLKPKESMQTATSSPSSPSSPSAIASSMGSSTRPG